MTGALLLWALAIAIVDWRWRRVPNALLLLAQLPALGCLVLEGRGVLAEGRLPALFGLLCGLGLTLPGYLAGRLGAGDVKLAAVMGLLQGWPLIGWTLLASALLLGAMSLVLVRQLGLAGARAMRLPAAVALAGGFMAVLLLDRGGWL